MSWRRMDGGDWSQGNQRGEYSDKRRWGHAEAGGWDGGEGMDLRENWKARQKVDMTR